jgi:ribose 5-phosphate isomerase B
MKIAFGCDHAGFEGPEPYYKPEIVKYLTDLGHEVLDCGTFGPESVDYPDYANAVCKAILKGNVEVGVLLCGTGLGIGMAANRHPGIRAATCTQDEMVRLARGHNDANVLCIGRRLLSLEDCFRLIDIFLNTPFDGGERHIRRVGKMG